MKMMDSVCKNCTVLLLVFAVFAGCKTGLEKEGKGEQIKDVDGNFYNTFQIGTHGFWLSSTEKSWYGASLCEESVDCQALPVH